MMKKGQITVEFIIALVILFILFAFALFAYSEKNSGFTYSKQLSEAKNLANELALTVNKVYLAGSGTETAILLDDRGYGFDVNVVGRTVEVSWEGSHVDAPILTDNVLLGQLSAGSFVRIRNQGLVIIIEEL